MFGKKRLVHGLFAGVFAVVLVSGCATAPAPRIAPASSLVAPIPIAGNNGKYMSPYTVDGVLADWVDKAVNAKMGSAIGGAVGAQLGQKALENVPFIGGFLGEKVGNAAGQAIAIEASGGAEFIRGSSDLSFNQLDQLALFLYVKYSTNKHYKGALDATMAIYPELKTVYPQALLMASKGA